MKTFYHYENSRKRYSASYSAGEQTLYSVEYRVKQVNVFGVRLYSWIPVASLRSMKKFQDIKYLLEAKIYDDNRIKCESRRVYTNPFLEYQSYINNE